MKRLEKNVSILLLLFVCAANVAFAVPLKVDEDNLPPAQTEAVTTQAETVADTSTEKPKESPKVAEGSTVKPTQAATQKPTVKPTVKPTEKPTVKPTEKPTVKPIEKPKSNSGDDVVKEDDKIVLDADDEAIVLEPTLEPTLNIQNGSDQLENKKYLTKLGGFLWFLFTIIVSAVISFIISYRFYMMGRKDNHLLAEIRALKRDIDSKMVGTIGGFSEFDVSVSNSNKSYAKENSSIRSSKSIIDGEFDADSEIYKKWETKLNETSVSRNDDSRVLENDFEGRTDTRRITREVERRRPVKQKNTVGVKIKNVLNDIFPFDKK